MCRRRTPATTILLLCLTASGLAAKGQQYTVNLLRNGGFETGWNDEDGHDWLWNWTPGLAGLDDAIAREGKRSLRIRVQGRKDMFDGLAQSARFRVLPDTTYHVSVYVKASGVRLHAKGAASAAISVTWYDEKWQAFRTVRRGTSRTRTARVASLAESDSEWRLLKGTVRSPAGAFAARVELAMSGATGTVWFDDVKFEYQYETNARLVPLSRGKTFPTMYPELKIYQAAAPPVIDGNDRDMAWNTFPHMRLLPAYPGQHITDVTLFRVCFDKEALYLYVRCHRSTGAARRKMKKRVDAEVWKNDCVGVFIRPPGVKDIHKIIVNISGAIYDAAGDEARWNSNTLVTLLHDAPSWSVEMKIPYESLKTPSPQLGAIWGMNVCRYRPDRDELVATTATSDIPPNIVDLGGVKFRFKRMPTTGARRTPKARVIGQLLDQFGPAAGVMVSMGPLSCRATSRGLYCIENVGFALQDVVVHPEQHGRFIARVLVGGAKTYLPAIRVQATDPQRLRFPVETLPIKGDYGLSVHPYLLPATPDRKPKDDSFQAPMRVRAARGEYEPAAFAIYARTPLKKVQIHANDLVGRKTQAVLRQDAIAPFVVRLQRKRNGVADRTVQRTVLCPEILEPYTPFDLDKNCLRDIWLSVHVPENQPPDTYSGSIQVLPENGRPAAVPLHVKVLPIRLVKPVHKKHGVHAGPGTSSACLRDMREHGVDVVAFRTASRASLRNGKIIVYSGAGRRVLERLADSGLQGPVIVTPAPIEKIMYYDLLGLLLDISREQRKKLYVADVTNLRQIAATLDAGPILFAPLDRRPQSTEGRKDWQEHCKWIQETTRTGIFSRGRLRDLFDTGDRPEVQVRCYDAGDLEHLDMGELREISPYLTDGKPRAWFESNPTTNLPGEKPLLDRLANGFYLWASPFEVRMRHAYRDVHGDPYNDLDDELGEGGTLTYPNLTTGEPVSTPQWEAYREGVDDLRYIATLERLIERAKKVPAANAERKVGEEVLKGIRDEIDKYRPGVSRLLKNLSGKDYDRYRGEIASAIIALQKALPAPDER